MSEEWAIIEIMGHLRRAGRTKQVSRFGVEMLQVDIPHEDGFTTEFYGGASIYAFRPCSEEIARNAAAQIGDPRPAAPLVYRQPEQPALRPPPFSAEFEEVEDPEFEEVEDYVERAPVADAPGYNCSDCKDMGDEDGLDFACIVCGKTWMPF